MTVETASSDEETAHGDSNDSKQWCRGSSDSMHAEIAVTVETASTSVMKKQLNVKTAMTASSGVGTAVTVCMQIRPVETASSLEGHLIQLAINRGKSMRGRWSFSITHYESHHIQI